MGKGEPIRCRKDIDRLKNYFLQKNEPRNYALVVMSMNTVFKVTELLSLQWGDVYDFEKNTFRQETRIRPAEGGRENAAFLNPEIIRALEAVKADISELSEELYIFKSRKGANRPISRGRAFTIIKEAARELGMKENVSCEALRKTFGYQAWKQGVQPECLQAVYRQFSLNATERYLEIEEKQEIPALKVQV